jgi:hypothetical protein
MATPARLERLPGCDIQFLVVHAVRDHQRHGWEPHAKRDLRLIGGFEKRGKGEGPLGRLVLPVGPGGLFGSRECQGCIDRSTHRSTLLVAGGENGYTSRRRLTQFAAPRNDRNGLPLSGAERMFRSRSLC